MFACFSTLVETPAQHFAVSLSSTRAFKASTPVTHYYKGGHRSES